MSDVILQTQSLCKHFGGVVATDNVGLQIQRGETHALIGPNGAGKTTLVAQLSGLLKPDSGEVLFEGKKVTGLPAHRLAKHGIARSFQITSVFMELSVYENILIAVQANAGHGFSFWKPLVKDVVLNPLADALIKKMNLNMIRDQEARNISHGEKRQLELAMVLAQKPKLMLLDEPMAGMGHDESQNVISLLNALKKDVTLLLIEHDIDAVYALADRITVLVRGKIIATGTVDEIRASRAVKEAYLGEAA